MALISDICVGEIFPRICLEDFQEKKLHVASCGVILRVSKDWNAMGWAFLKNWASSNPSAVSDLFLKLFDGKQHDQINRPFVACLFNNLGPYIKNLNFTVKVTTVVLQCILKCPNLTSIRFSLIKGKKRSVLNLKAHFSVISMPSLRKLIFNPISSPILSRLQFSPCNFDHITHLDLYLESFEDKNFRLLDKFPGLIKINLRFFNQVANFSDNFAEMLNNTKIRSLSLEYFIAANRGRSLIFNEYFIKSFQNSPYLLKLKISNKTNLSNKLLELSNFDFVNLNGVEKFTKKEIQNS